LLALRQASKFPLARGAGVGHPRLLLHRYQAQRPTDSRLTKPLQKALARIAGISEAEQRARGTRGNDFLSCADDEHAHRRA
jgi:hypothetical protein